LLDEVIDDWVASEKANREKKGMTVSKLQLKTELGRAIGLGNGSDSEDAALKGVYRYCSGETPLSLEKAIAVCRHIDDYRIAEWFAFRCGLLTTPRSTIEDLETLENEDVFLQLVEAQKQTSSFIALLSSIYQQKPSLKLMTDIENSHQKAALSMEKGRASLLALMEKMMKSEAGKV
jgi:hypothetical protein